MKSKLDRCPVCGTMVNPVNHRPLCIHVCWKVFSKSKHTGEWIVVQTFHGTRKTHVQGQKYSVNWRWRQPAKG